MAVLGEAFINVRADMSPFRRDLRDETQKEADLLEQAYGPKLAKVVSKAIKDGGKDGVKELDLLNQAYGTKLGKVVAEAIGIGAEEGTREASSKIRKGLDKDLGKGSSILLAITGAMAGALDDGISALPAEIKASIVGSLLAITPLISGAMAGAIGAGVVLGFSGLGLALASQLESVQTFWPGFLTRTRNTLVQAALPFEKVLLETLGQVEERLTEWGPMLERIFTRVAPLFDTILGGILDGAEFFLDGLEAGLGDAGVFAEALGDALAIVGKGMGDVFRIIMMTGEDGATAFLDLVFVLTDLMVTIARMINLFTELYAWVRKFVQSIPDWAAILYPPVLLFKILAEQVDSAADQNVAYAYTNTGVESSILGVVAATKDEEKALQEAEKAILDAQSALFKSIDTNIAYERSLDDIEEAIKRNGKTLDVDTEKGRQNLEAIGTAIKLAQQKAKERADSGKYNADQLTAAYSSEIERIYKAAEAQGVSRDRLREVYGVIIDILNAPPPDTEWARQLAMYAAAAASALERANKAAWNLPNRLGGPQPFAEGGIVYGPTQALIGEAGAEAVIPMTRPARAAEIMRQSGLDRMMSSSGSTNVYVYLGNEAFDQHVQKIVVQDSRAQARQLTYGVRG